MSHSNPVSSSTTPLNVLPIYSTEGINFGVYNSGLQHEAPGKVKSSLQHRHHRKATGMQAKGGSQSYTTSEAKKFLDAAAKADKDVLIEMMECGTDSNICDDKKRTALHIASAKGHDKIVMTLLSHGADPNQVDILGNTPLHLASCTHHTSVITLLLKAGCKVDVKGVSGVSPLRYASGRLNMLIKDKSIKAEQLKSEIKQIVDLMHIYRIRQNTSIREVDTAGTELEKASTNDDFDAVNSVLQNILKLHLV